MQMLEELEESIHSLAGLTSTIAFMKEAIMFSHFEPALWPIGGVQIPKARWEALRSALVALQQKVGTDDPGPPACGSGRRHA